MTFFPSKEVGDQRSSKRTKAKNADDASRASLKP